MLYVRGMITANAFDRIEDGVFMKQILITNMVLLLSLMALTACPNNERNNNPAINPLTLPPPNGAANPSQNPAALDPSIKSFMCEFEGQRDKLRKHWNSIPMPKTTSLITINSGQRVYLRTKFFGFDRGNFGNIYMEYVPAERTKYGADTLNIVNRGLNKSLDMSQSGFAGEQVTLMVQDEGLFISISCKGTTNGTAPFKGAVESTGKTKLVCKGKSKTAASVDPIILEKPLNSILAGESFEITPELSAKLDSKATTITYETLLLSSGVNQSVTSSASLKSPSTFSIADKSIVPHAEIEVTCKLQ